MRKRKSREPLLLFVCAILMISNVIQYLLLEQSEKNSDFLLSNLNQIIAQSERNSLRYFLDELKAGNHDHVQEEMERWLDRLENRQRNPAIKVTVTEE